MKLQSDNIMLANYLLVMFIYFIYVMLNIRAWKKKSVEVRSVKKLQLKKQTSLS